MLRKTLRDEGVQDDRRQLYNMSAEDHEGKAITLVATADERRPQDATRDYALAVFHLLMADRKTLKAQ